MFKFRLLILGFLLFFLAVVGKLLLLSVVDPKVDLEDIYLQDSKILPERGRIYDSSGKPLVINKSAYSLYFEPNKIKDPTRAVSAIDEILKMGEATLTAKID